jgi:hypothetical protein
MSSYYYPMLTLRPKRKKEDLRWIDSYNSSLNSVYDLSCHPYLRQACIFATLCSFSYLNRAPVSAVELSLLQEEAFMRSLVSGCTGWAGSSTESKVSGQTGCVNTE